MFSIKKLYADLARSLPFDDAAAAHAALERVRSSAGAFGFDPPFKPNVVRDAKATGAPFVVWLCDQAPRLTEAQNQNAYTPQMVRIEAELLARFGDHGTRRRRPFRRRAAQLHR